MTPLEKPQIIDDGGKSVTCSWDYCSYNTDWTAKRELFAYLVLRAYSQKKFVPKEDDSNQTDQEWVNDVTRTVSEFIKHKIANDLDGIRREV